MFLVVLTNSSVGAALPGAVKAALALLDGARL